MTKKITKKPAQKRARKTAIVRSETEVAPVKPDPEVFPVKVEPPDPFLDEVEAAAELAGACFAGLSQMAIAVAQYARKKK